ncbi:DUF3375 domain-containing protein [Methanolobus sp. ZRKC2]|uniref:DUF3375 domain-containing protein n=1 Tax=Methanolobus sp. ZRKC2 TaxID=3125783 RepID=UPI0032521FAE
MEHRDIKRLKDEHPAIKIINADNSPLIISFLNQQFKETTVHEIPKDELKSNLSNYLYHLEKQESIKYPRQPSEYLEDWTNSGFLGTFRSSSDDMIYFELTHHTENALHWIKNLIETRKFVGTESRLLVIISTLKELAYTNTDNPIEKLNELKKQKQEIELKIEKAEAGIVDTLTDTQIRERYFNICETVDNMLTDFKEIEHNLRVLDGETRKKLLQVNVQKGEVLDEVVSAEDIIFNSDQGKSLEALRNLLRSYNQQDELEKLIGMVLATPQIQEVKQQSSILENMLIKLSRAGGRVQIVDHSLAEQLSRFLNNQNFLENKRIMEVIGNIKSVAFEIKDNPPTDVNFVELGDKADIEMVMDRTLWTSKTTTKLQKREVVLGSADDNDASILYNRFSIDKKELEGRIQKFLEKHSQVSLKTIIEAYPIEKGIDELVAYITIASDDENAVINGNIPEIKMISNNINQMQFLVQIPQIIFCRSEI